ncbi:nucleolar protein 8 [Dissophora ornata]|nr:nucleolar protein 8 [Dissophora ornata]
MFAEDETATATATKPVKVKKPKVPKPPLDPNEHITQRAFIGGLAKEVTPTDLEGRFKSFGQLKDVYLAKDLDGSCRGFGYVTLDTTRKEWLKCMALFNGAKWKGNAMKIEEANKDWQTRRKEDLEGQAKLEKKEHDALLKKIKMNPAKHAQDMSLITDKNMDGKRGWKRGRFGRPVITMKFDKMTYDPSHYKNNAEKLFNLPGKPLPLDKLIYEIDENEPKPKGKHLPTEVALAPFFSTSKSLKPANATTTTASTEKTKKSIADKTTNATNTTAQSQSLDRINANVSDDRAMMASILAGIDMSPRALSLDGSDIEDTDEDGRGAFMEDFGGLHDTKADDLFGDVVMDDATAVLSKSQSDSRPEDLFGDDGDEDESQANRPSLDFLDDSDDQDEEEEYEEDQDEEDEEDEEEYEQDQDEEEEEEEGDDDGMDEETIQAIAQLQGASSTSGGGLFDSDDDGDNRDGENATNARLAEESNVTRLKAMEAREAELEAARGKQQQLIASTLANIDSRDKKTGHVVFSDSDDYDSEDYEKMEADHAQKQLNMNKPAKSIFDSDSESDEEKQDLSSSKTKKKGAKEMFASDDENDDAGPNKFGETALNIKEQFEGPGGKALFQMQTKIGTSDSRFQLTKDFLDERIQAEDDADFIAHQDRLKGDEFASTGAAGIVLDEDRQVDADVSAEKMQAMNVLRAMFGDSAVRSKKKEEDMARQAKGGLGYTTGLAVRYDPDAAPPPPPPPSTQPETTVQDSKTSAFDSDSEAEPSKPSSEEEDEQQDGYDSESMEEKSDEEMEEPQETQPAKKSVGFSFAFDSDNLNDSHEGGSSGKSATSTSSNPPSKDLDTTPKFQIATDLKSLFAPTAGTFKMFGGDDDEDEDDENDLGGDVEDDRQVDNDNGSQDEILTSYTDGSRTIFANGADALTARAPLSHSGSMFFFHFKNPALLKRSNFKTNNKAFMRTSTMDEVTANWEKTRHAMTQEFKRKHKSASRNKARASKRFKAGGGGAGGLGDHA